MPLLTAGKVLNIYFKPQILCFKRKKKIEIESSAFPKGSVLNSLSKDARESLINSAKVSSRKMGLGCLVSDYCIEQMEAVIHIR